jgi:Protein of unknown function (DUF4242)
MPRFMDFHEDLKLPHDAIAQIADDTRHERADEFGVRQVELYHNPEGQVYCLLDGPDEDAIRKHHAALGVDCGAVHRVDGITWGCRLVWRRSRRWAAGPTALRWPRDQTRHPPHSGNVPAVGPDRQGVIAPNVPR